MNQNEIKGLIAHRAAQLNRLYLKVDYFYAHVKALKTELINGTFLMIKIENEEDYKNVKDILGYSIEKSEPDCYDSLYWCKEDPDIIFQGAYLWGLSNP